MSDTALVNTIGWVVVAIILGLLYLRFNSSLNDWDKMLKDLGLAK